MYLLNIQYELPGSQLLEIGYEGSQLKHIEQLIAVNEALPGPQSIPIAQRSPFPEFGRIQLVDNGGYGNYNAFSAKLTKRYSSGLTYMFGYTWSRSLDTGSAIRTHDGDTLFPQNSYCRNCEYGLSSFHTGHRFVSSILYDLPVGKGRPVEIDNPVLNHIVGRLAGRRHHHSANRLPHYRRHRRPRPVQNRRRLRPAERHRRQPVPLQSGHHPLL